jgi:site-specific recombinase XerD
MKSQLYGAEVIHMLYPTEILTADEARALLHAPSSTAPTGVRNRALIAVLYGAGLRISEALALKVSDINVDTASVRVLHGKNDKARTIGIDAGALVHVVRWIEMRRGLGLRGRWLFCTLKGGPVSSTYVRAMFKRIARRTSIEKRVHPHGLRHTHAVELDAAGFTVLEIQKQLGHEHLNTTAIYLDHHAPSALIAKVRDRRMEI